jgi:hypothetical protein
VADGDLLIRSYRLCFELERRIHRIDRWRIPAPYGVPLRGVAYGAVALAAVLVLQRLPITGELLGVLHPALRFVILPIAVACALTRLRVDGRPAHAAALAWLRWRLTPSSLAAFRAAERRGLRLLGDLAIAADEGSSLYRRALIRGPATVTARYPARARARARKLELRQAGGGPLWRGKRIRLAEGQRLVVR